MPNPLVVLVLVAAGGKAEPTPSSFMTAAREVLGPETVVLYEEQAFLPAKDDALQLGERIQAGAVVELAWGDRGDRVTVRVHTADRTTWAERSLDLPPSETPPEYGRTLGFAVASMITTLTASVPAPAVPSAPTSAPPPATAQTPVSPPPAPSPIDARPAPALPPPPGPAPRGERRPRYHIEAAFLGTAGAGAGANALGTAARAGIALAGPMALELGAQIRFGDVGTAGATFWSARLGAGVSWHAIATSGARPFELDVRAGLYAANLVVSRGAETRSRVIPEADLALEAIWFLIDPHVGIALSAGCDATLGTTAVVVGDDTLASFALVRLEGTLGVRVRF